MARYGEKAQDSVESAMHRRKRGTLRSGGSGKKVTSRKQAIAIGLSEAREKGAKVPSKSGTRRAKSGSKKTGARKTRTKQTAARRNSSTTSRKKSASRKKSTSRKRTSTRKSSASRSR